MSNRKDTKLASEGLNRLLSLQLPSMAVLSTATSAATTSLVHSDATPDVIAARAGLLHDGAVQYLQTVSAGGEVWQHDYLVIDVMLRAQALHGLTQALLASTIWFDATNGAAFAAHPDDGLVLPELQSLAQQLAWALSPASVEGRGAGSATRSGTATGTGDGFLRVERYYVIAMPLTHDGRGPVSMGE